MFILRSITRKFGCMVFGCFCTITIVSSTLPCVANDQSLDGILNYDGVFIKQPSNQEHVPALDLLRDLADKGDIKAMMDLAHYWLRKGDEHKAHFQYLNAANHGHCKAQWLIGKMYLGEALESVGYRHPHKAIQWFRKAANHDNHTAYDPSDGFLHRTDSQTEIALMYYKGNGVIQNYAEAIKWFRKAALYECPRALYQLGIIHELGHGLPQDYCQAHMYFNIAGTRNWLGEYDKRYKAIFDAVDRRDKIAAKMTSVQIAQAHKLADQWFQTAKNEIEEHDKTVDKSVVVRELEFLEGFLSTTMRVVRSYLDSDQWEIKKPINMRILREAEERLRNESNPYFDELRSNIAFKQIRK